MEELLELRTLLLGGNIADALLLVEEMTEMSKDDKINKIFSFSIILLMHLIKQQAEQRSTRSWKPLFLIQSNKFNARISGVRQMVII